MLWLSTSTVLWPSRFKFMLFATVKTTCYHVENASYGQKEQCIAFVTSRVKILLEAWSWATTVVQRCYAYFSMSMTILLVFGARLRGHFGRVVNSTRWCMWIFLWLRHILTKHDFSLNRDAHLVLLSTNLVLLSTNLVLMSANLVLPRNK